jgi:hypothetical protein
MNAQEATILLFGSKQAGFWDAFKQGQFAKETGIPRERNPFDLAPLQAHITTSDWYRGWDKGIPTIVRLHASGGITNYADYEMSDGSIKTINYRDLDDMKGGK